MSRYEGTAANLPRDEDGLLTQFAWPGGYELYYLYSDGEICCAGCARQQEVDNFAALMERRVESGDYTVLGLTAPMSLLEPELIGYGAPGATEDYPDEETGPLVCAMCNRTIVEVEA